MIPLETDPWQARFVPQLALVGRVDDLPISPTAARALRALLWTCRTPGMGQGCGDHEAMTILRRGGLAKAMGAVGSINRVLMELQAAHLLRRVLVHRGQRLPDPRGAGETFTGNAVASGCCVYYVSLDACWRGIGRPDLAGALPVGAPEHVS